MIWGIPASEFLPTRPTPLRVLVATDGSEHASAGIALLSQFRLHPQTEITVVHVLKRMRPFLTPRVPPGYRGEYQRAMREIREEEDAPTARIVTQAQNALAATEVRAEAFVVEGRASEQLVSLTRTRKPHLIVVGSSGLGRLAGVSPLTETVQESEEPTWSPLLD